VVLNGVPSQGSYYYYHYYSEDKREEPTGSHSLKQSRKMARRLFGENGSHGEKDRHAKPEPSRGVKPLAALVQLFRRRG
jgi:hypothetical protein